MKSFPPKYPSELAKKSNKCFLLFIRGQGGLGEEKKQSSQISCYSTLRKKKLVKFCKVYHKNGKFSCYINSGQVTNEDELSEKVI
jgi:hypothetical protein